jgi:hypothetical protein
MGNLPSRDQSSIRRPYGKYICSGARREPAGGTPHQVQQPEIVSARPVTPCNETASVRKTEGIAVLVLFTDICERPPRLVEPGELARGTPSVIEQLAIG